MEEKKNGGQRESAEAPPTIQTRDRRRHNHSPHPRSRRVEPEKSGRGRGAGEQRSARSVYRDDTDFRLVYLEPLTASLAPRHLRWGRASREGASVGLSIEAALTVTTWQFTN